MLSETRETLAVVKAELEPTGWEPGIQLWHNMGPAHYEHFTIYCSSLIKIESNNLKQIWLHFLATLEQSNKSLREGLSCNWCSGVHMKPVTPAGNWLYDGARLTGNRLTERKKCYLHTYCISQYLLFIINYYISVGLRYPRQILLAKWKTCPYLFYFT